MALKPKNTGKKRPNRAHPSNSNQHNSRHPSKAGDRRNNAPSYKLSAKDTYLLYGRNSVEAALKNKNRECLRLIGTAKGLAGLTNASHHSDIRTQQIDTVELMTAHIPADAPHQGVFLEVRPLAGMHIDDLEPLEGQKNIVLMLDQVTDPHNVGACLRSAAAFGARAVITQDRHSPGESGTLARSAAGALETVPWIRAHNLAQALETLKDIGYWHVGLDGHTDTSIKDVNMGDNIVIVMGSEGSGIRPLVRKHCDVIAKIPMSGMVESLNVSNAAAIALYALAN